MAIEDPITQDEIDSLLKSMGMSPGRELLLAESKAKWRDWIARKKNLPKVTTTVGDEITQDEITRLLHGMEKGDLYSDYRASRDITTQTRWDARKASRAAKAPPATNMPAPISGVRGGFNDMIRLIDGSEHRLAVFGGRPLFNNDYMLLDGSMVDAKLVTHYKNTGGSWSNIGGVTSNAPNLSNVVEEVAGGNPTPSDMVKIRQRLADKEKKVSDIIRGNSATYRNDTNLTMLTDLAVERRLGAKVILEKHIPANQLKGLLDVGISHEEILDEIRKQIKSTPPLVTPTARPTSLMSQAEIDNILSAKVVTPAQLVRVVTPPPGVRGRGKYTTREYSDRYARGVVSSRRYRSTRWEGKARDILEEMKSSQRRLDTVGARFRRRSNRVEVDNPRPTSTGVADEVKKATAPNTGASIPKVNTAPEVKAAQKVVEANSLAKVSSNITKGSPVDRAIASLPEVGVEGIAKKALSKGSILSREAGTVVKWFGSQSKIFKVGAIAGGAWLAVALLSRTISPILNIGRGNAAPGYVQDVYNEIDSGSTYPPVADPRIYPKRSPVPRVRPGIPQQLHNERSGHHRVGAAKTDYYNQMLYQQ